MNRLSAPSPRTMDDRSPRSRSSTTSGTASPPCGQVAATTIRSRRSNRWRRRSAKTGFRRRSKRAARRCPRHRVSGTPSRGSSCWQTGSAQTRRTSRSISNPRPTAWRASNARARSRRDFSKTTGSIRPPSERASLPSRSPAFPNSRRVPSRKPSVRPKGRSSSSRPRPAPARRKPPSTGSPGYSNASLQPSSRRYPGRTRLRQG